MREYASLYKTMKKIINTPSFYRINLNRSYSVIETIGYLVEYSLSLNLILKT